MAKTKDSVGIAVLVVVVLMLLISGMSWGGDLQPSAPPGPTMKTLDQIPPTWSQVLSASVRFEVVMGGEAVLDKETGLVWQRNNQGQVPQPWLQALYYCNRLVNGGRKGWRLPLVEEIESLIDPSQVESGFAKRPSIQYNY